MWTMNLQMFKLDLEETGNRRSNYHYPLDHQKSKRVPEKHFCIIDFTKAFDCVAHNKLQKILQEMGLSDHLTCLLRSLNVGQETIVKTGHERTDRLQIGKGVDQGCILSPCLFNLSAEYILWNSRLDEAQAGIRIAGRNINNFRYTDAPPLWQKVKNN